MPRENSMSTGSYRGVNRKSSFSSSSSGASEYSYKYGRSMETTPDSEVGGADVADKSNPENYRSSWIVYLAVFLAQMSSVSMGSAFGWSGPALDDIFLSHDVTSNPYSFINRNTNFTIDTHGSDGSWIASSVTIGAFFGAFACGYLMDTFGRRKSILLLGIPYGIGWGLITVAWSFWPIVIGRFLTGLAIGITTAVVPTYIAEISTPDNRGLLGMTFNFFVVGGMFYMDLIYVFDLHWYQISACVLLPVAIFVIAMFFMPESPTWAINKIEDSTESIDVAREALKRLRSSKSDRQGELNDLIQGAMKISASGDSNLKLSFSTFTRRDVVLPMGIGAMLLLFQQFCGINAMQFYLHEIFESSGSILSPKISALISNGFMLMATVVGSALVDKFGRRPLYIISAIGLMLSIGALGVHILINDNDTPHATSMTMSPTFASSMATLNSTESNSSTTNFATFSTTELSTAVTEAFNSTTIAPDSDKKPSSLVPLICVTVFGIAFSLGVGPICWIIITEITPPQTIGLIVSISSAFAWLFTFTVVRFTGSVVDVVGRPATYFGFAAFSFLSAVFIYFMPETKGKTKEELSRIFKFD